MLSLPKAGNDFTSRFQGCDWFSCRQDHWHSRTDDLVWHIICAEDPAGTSMTFSCFANVIGMPETYKSRQLSVSDTILTQRAPRSRAIRKSIGRIFLFAVEKAISFVHPRESFLAARDGSFNVSRRFVAYRCFGRSKIRFLSREGKCDDLSRVSVCSVIHRRDGYQSEQNSHEFTA